MPRITNIQIRKGTSTEWSTQNPVLDSGELGFDVTNKIFKIGDGATAWNSLSSINLTSSNITDFNTTVSGLVSSTYAPINNPIFTGSPSVPTAATGTNTNQIASTQFVITAFNAVSTIQGTQGVQGPQGVQGRQGVQGTTGSQGSQGVQGVQGTTGSQGTVGSQGSQGVQGTTGSQGTVGSQGSQGVQGTVGSQGITGTTGSQGSIGSQGTTGSQGVQGITGPVAGSANQIVYKNSSNIVSGSANFTFDGTDVNIAGGLIATSIAGNASNNNVVDGRLTIYTGEPIGSEVGNTFGNILYFTPFNGNRISLYDTTNSRWKIHTFSEISISLASGYAANTMYDVFIHDNAGTKTLELTAWTTQGGYASPAATASARSTGSVLALQDGVYVKSGSANKRYLGTVRTNATAGFISDGPDQRFLWNMYNRVSKKMDVMDATSHTYATGAFRLYRNQSTNIVEFITGLDKYTMVNMSITVSSQVNPASSIPVGIGVDANSPVGIAVVNNVDTATLRAGASDCYFSDQGYHYLAITQYGATGATFNNVYLTASITC
jgi:hypothetical protein